MIATLPLVVYFGTGVLTKHDLHHFSWTLVLLIAGGNVLGSAVNASKLLHTIAEHAMLILSGRSLFVTTLCVLLMVFFVTTFVSHTVSALILSPIIVSIGASIGNERVLSLITAWMMSSTMSLPMSSFPNINALLVDDDFTRVYLHSSDFLKHGTVISVTLFALISTVGYALCSFML